jgi:hypothetical protein
MAFKLKPGRGNNAKTGHGIPSPFKQEGPKTEKMKSQVAKKEKAGLTNVEMEDAKKFAAGAPGTGVLSGTTKDIETGETSAKAFEKKLVKQPGGDVFMTDASGKTLESAKYNAYGNKAVQALEDKYKSLKHSTEDARKAATVAQNSRIKMARG